jgi:hypothetical protein
MVIGNRTQFHPSYRVPHQDRSLQLQRGNHGHYVLSKAVSRVIRGCITGRAESAPCNPVNMELCYELRSEIIEYVSHIAAPGQKDDWPAMTTPIEYFQPNILINAHESRAVG